MRLTKLLGLMVVGLVAASIWTATGYPLADKLLLTACLVGLAGLVRWATEG